MRKVEEKMLAAIRSKHAMCVGNTSVEYVPEISTMTRSCIEHAKVYLYGNHVGTYVYSLGVVHFNKATLDKWPTRTTKSRVSALLTLGA